MPRLCSSLLLLVVTLQGSTTAFRPSRQWGLVTKAEVNLCSSSSSSSSSSRSSDVIQRLRAGATDDDEEEEEEDDDEEEEEEDEDEVEVEEEEDEEEEEEETDDEEEETSELIEAAATEDDDAAEYDAMLIPSPSLQMYSVIGVMLLARKLDMFSPTVVKAGRYVSMMMSNANTLLYCATTPITLTQTHTTLTILLSTHTNNNTINATASYILPTLSFYRSFFFTFAFKLNPSITEPPFKCRVHFPRF